VGGDWHNWEVKTLRNPTIEDVKVEVESISSDYSFIVFSGHGGIETTEGRMYVELGEEYLFIGELKTKSRWQTLIFDTCRTFFVKTKSFSLKKAMKEAVQPSIIHARQRFEASLQRCEEGVIQIYSSLPGQASGDDPEAGGVFSSSFIRAGKIWGENEAEGDSVMDLRSAFDKGVVIMNNTFLTTQEPQLNVGRRRFVFPFAIRNSRI
jgi:hypothetical protein